MGQIIMYEISLKTAVKNVALVCMQLFHVIACEKM